MRDFAFIGFLLVLFWFALRRPFLFVLSYVYVDTLQPQRLSYLLFNKVPVSLICFGLAFASWLFVGDKSETKMSPRQWMMTALLCYCWMTTQSADFPTEAALKWGWVWKSLIFAVFLPFTLNTRLRMEALAMFMIVSASSIIIVGGIKTLVTGGGYGSLNLMVTNNSGIYESSTISMVAIAIIPIIMFFLKHGTIFPLPDWRVKLFCYALIFACILIPIGTQARTGLICAAVIFVMSLRHAKRPFLFLSLALVLGLVSLPLLPKSFTARMGTINNYQADSSASTRIAVWKWTWAFAQDHPFGGGFEAYRQNKIHYEAKNTTETGSSVDVQQTTIVDAGRAFHSSYFEMLGEQGYPGFLLWITIHLLGLWRMEKVYRRFKMRAPEDGLWISDLASALQKAHVCYLIGSLFVGMAFQSFVYMLVGIQIAVDVYASRILDQESWRPMRGGTAKVEQWNKPKRGLTPRPE
jgi:probable O-glycosylation ligase (exosortase A-associated)